MTDMPPPMPAVADRVLPGEESLTIASRTVQWRIDVPKILSQKSSCSRTFKLTNCNWCLKLEVLRHLNSYNLNLSVLDSGNQYVHARFALRIALGNMTWESCFNKEVTECFSFGGKSFKHSLDGMCDKRLVIDFEFLEVKISHSNDPELESEPLVEEKRQGLTSTQVPLNCLSRMFTESINADVTINTKDGTLSAHRAVLASSSPVFACMFDNDFKEKASSTINIQDMSFESCKVFLSYLYGVLKEEDFRVHRYSLLEASRKYGIVMLQSDCEKSLMEDINVSNVLERLEKAHLYELKNLKKECFGYLFDLGRVYAIVDDFNRFTLDADRELATEIMLMMLSKLYCISCPTDDPPKVTPHQSPIPAFALGGYIYI